MKIYEKENMRLRARMKELEDERSLPKCDASTIGDAKRCVLLAHNGYTSHVLGEPCPKLKQLTDLRAELAEFVADNDAMREWNERLRAQVADLTLDKKSLATVAKEIARQRDEAQSTLTAALVLLKRWVDPAHGHSRPILGGDTQAFLAAQGEGEK